MLSFKDYYENLRSTHRDEQEQEEDTTMELDEQEAIVLSKQEMDAAKKLANRIKGRGRGMDIAMQNAMGRIALKKLGLNTPPNGVITTSNKDPKRAYVSPDKLTNVATYTAFKIDLPANKVFYLGKATRDKAVPALKMDPNNPDALYIPLDIFTK